MHRFLVSFGLCALVAGILLGGPSAAWAQRVYGVTMPANAIKVDDEHFRSNLSYDKTIRHFSRQYGRSRGIVWQPIRGSSSVKGVHIVNNNARRKWDAINIYKSGRKVFMYVVKSEQAPKKKR